MLTKATVSKEKGTICNELYHPTIYERKTTFDEFWSDFRRFESQLARMMAGIALEYEKADKVKEEDLSNF